MSDSGKRIIRARYLDKGININSMFKKEITADNIFNHENWPGKDMAQMQILYQTVNEENSSLKRRLGQLDQIMSQGSSSTDKVECLVRDGWRKDDFILEMEKKIIRLEEEIRNLKGTNMNDKEMGR